MVATIGTIQLARDADQARVDDVLLGHAVAHHFDVEPVAEDVDVGLGVLDRGRVVVFEQRRGDHARHAAREHDQAVVVLGQQIQVDARLVIVAFEKALGDQRGEVPVADQVGRQQRDVGLFADRAVEAAARGDVGLAADDRGQAGVPGGVVELHGAVHHAVVGQRDGGGRRPRRCAGRGGRPGRRRPGANTPSEREDGRTGSNLSLDS